MTFTLRDDEADARMSELHERYMTRWLDRAVRVGDVFVSGTRGLVGIMQGASIAAHQLVSFIAAEHVKAGNLVTIKGNMITVTRPLVGTCNVSIGVAPHA